MTDTKSIPLLNLLHPAIRHDAISAYKDAVRKTDKNCHPVIEQTIRSPEAQNKLPSSVTKAKAGQSFHQYGLALDFHLIIDGKDYWPETKQEAVANKNWMIVIKCFEENGFESGLYWKSITDAPHLQKTLGYTWQQLLALYKADKFIPVNTYIDLT